MKCRILFTLRLGCLVNLILMSVAEAGTLIGRITDAESGFGVEGAEVTLEPSNPEITVVSGPFGFYRIGDVAEGRAFTLTATHPAYGEAAATVEPLSADDNVVNNFALNRRNPAAIILDIQVSVRAVGHGSPLFGIPVRAWRFSTADGSDQAEERLTFTDANGHADFRGFEAGYFQFAINAKNDGPKPFYDPIPANGTRTDLQRLEMDYALTALLKHQRQSLSFIVRGFDPIGEVSGSLENVIVELTGLSPIDQSTEVVPTRTTTTDSSGLVSFVDLPPIPWRVKAKKLGYDVFEQIITPAVGTCVLPAGRQNILMTYQERSLVIELESLYEDIDWLYQNISVTLDGIPGTATEGITREASHPGMFTGQPRHDERNFRGLIPGRYRLSLAGKSDLQNSFYPLPYFSATDIVELNDNAAFDGTIATRRVLRCEVAPATIRGRVFAADALTSPDVDDPNVPIYLPKEVSGLTFGELTGNGAVNLLLESGRNREVTTDELGFFTIQLPPTVYGVSIPSAEDYWGDHIDFKDETAKIARSQGWPYPATWPFPFPSSPPKGNATFPSLPLVLESNRDYSINFYLHRQLGHLQINVQETSGEAGLGVPTRRLAGVPTTHALYSDVLTPDTEDRQATFTATSETGDVHTGIVANDRVTFSALPPGTYTITGEHARFDFNTITQTIESWQPPGSLPTRPPAPLGVNLGQPLYLYTQGLLDLVATYKDTTSSFVLNVRSWDPIDEAYGPTTPLGFDRTEFVSLLDVNGALFASSQSKLPQGAFEFWYPINNGFYMDVHPDEGESTSIDLFSGGPNATPANSTGPAATFTVVPRAIYVADGSLVPNATFRSGNNPAAPADGTPVQVMGTLQGFGNITAPAGWIALGSETEFLGVNGTSSRLSLTTRFTKLMTIAVNVTDATTDAPLTDASIRVRSATGAALNSTGLQITELVHRVGGEYVVGDPLVAPTLQAKECLIEIEARGYEPFAMRVIPNAMPTPATLTLSAGLQRLPAPTIETAGFNRYGLFVPGVRFTGDEKGLSLDPLDAERPLAASWHIRGRDANVTTLSLPTVDGDPNAAANGRVSRQLIDRVASVYVIGKSAFDGNVSDPNVTIIPSRPADPTSPASVHNWIRRVADGTLPNVVAYRADELNFNREGNQFDLGSIVQLHTLPPGDFEPYFVAVTNHGAVAVQELPDYPGDAETHKLTGAPIPKWLSFATNVLGAVASSRANIEKAADLVPTGDFMPLGDFTAAITHDAESPGFIDYTYGMGTEWNFGIGSPKEDFLAFAPGIIGINAKAKTTFGAIGKEKRLYLEVTGTAQNEPAELSKKRRPHFLKDESIKVRGVVNARSTISRNYGEGPYELEVKTELPEINGTVTGFGFTIEHPLDDRVLKVPGAGPKLFLMAKLGVLNFFGEFDAFVGLTGSRTFRTPFPPPTPEPTASQLPGQPSNPASDVRANRMHMFGGTAVSSAITYQAAFGAGVITRVAGGRLEAKAGMSLAGNRRAGRNFMRIVPNTFSDWPWIKRVSGSVNLNLEAKANLYVWEGKKEYTWPAFPFDHQFGTDAVFALTPVTIKQQRLTLKDTGQAFYRGAATQAMTGYNPLAKFGVTARADEPVLMFTDYDESNDQLAIKVATRDGDIAWSSAVLTVAHAKAITAATVLSLSDGRSLLAWTAVPEDDLNEAFPSTHLFYVVQDDSASGWSDPVLATEFSGAVVELFPIENADWSGLVAFESTGGLIAPLRMHALLWEGENFGGLQTDGNTRQCLAFAAAGSGSAAIPAQILCLENDGLHRIAWDGSTFDESTLSGNDDGALDITSDGAGNMFMVRSQRGSGIVIFSSTDGGAFSPLGEPVPSGASKMNVSYLADPQRPALLITWIRRGSVHAIFTDPTTGERLTEIQNLTNTPAGSHSGLKVLPAISGAHASILARYRQDDHVELREIEISLDEGAMGLNDTDGDGLDDLAELRIVDADNTDNVRSIESVLPNQDFDNDNVSNQDEIDAGSDPVDFFSVPDGFAPPATSPLFLIQSVQRLPDGSFTVIIPAIPGKTYRLEASPSLSGFESVTERMASGPTLELTDPNRQEIDYYYRVVRMD